LKFIQKVRTKEKEREKERESERERNYQNYSLLYIIFLTDSPLNMLEIPEDIGENNRN